MSGFFSNKTPIKIKGKTIYIEVTRRRMPAPIVTESIPCHSEAPLAAKTGHSGHEIADDMSRILSGRPMQFPKFLHGRAI